MKTEYNAQELAALAYEVHGLAVDRGWWDNPEGLTDVDLIEEKCLMIITEIAEAVDCYRKGKMDTYTGPLTPKPEGFQIEVADIAIRAMDLIMRRGDGFTDHELEILFTFIPDSNRSLTSLLRGACQDALDVCPIHVLSTCLVIAGKLNFNLIEAIRIKHGYNKTRSYRHGGKKI